MPSNQPAAIDTCMNRPMNNVQQAIRDAAEKGGYRYRWWKVNDLEHNEGYNGLQLRALTEHLHDPDFWKALAVTAYILGLAVEQARKEARTEDGKVQHGST
jgi:hypothetical protein